jgi:hypothetical protein
MSAETYLHGTQPIRSYWDEDPCQELNALWIYSKEHSPLDEVFDENPGKKTRPQCCMIPAKVSPD